MKKKLALLLVIATMMISGICTTAYAQTYKTGKVYVEGSSKAYGNGDTITVERGKTIHVAYISDGRPTLADDHFWFACWNPNPLTSNNFVLYGADGGDGANFKNSEIAYGPYVDTSKVTPGTYTMHFHLADSQDAFANGFAKAKEYDPIDVKIKVTKTSQKLVVNTAAKSVSSTQLKKKGASLSQVVKVSGAKTSVTYKKKSGSKYIGINKKTGRITVKKATPKGKYTARITVSAAGDKNYSAAKKTVTVTVKVK